MPRLRILTLQLPESVEGAVLAAAGLLEPAAPVVALSASDPIAPPADDAGLEIVVAGTGAAENAARLARRLDAEGLTRTVVFLLGDSPPAEFEPLSLDECTPLALARRFREAWRRLELIRDNERLRGDLRTIARRYRHDLVAPVGSIHTSASVLESPPYEPAVSALMIHNIGDSAREISTLIDRMALVLSATAEPKAREPVVMGPLVAGVLARLAPAIDRHRARITLPAGWPAVEGVGPWIEAMWTNLIDNALKFGGPEPVVRLEVRIDGNEAVFSVCDRGAGAAEKQVPRLFTPFHLLTTQTSPGLGLAIVARLAALQGGRCAYRRTEGWSAFSFTLPRFVEVE
jgi:signal transduction histidine kinase